MKGKRRGTEEGRAEGEGGRERYGISKQSKTASPPKTYVRNLLGWLETRLAKSTLNYTNITCVLARVV